MSGLAEKPTNQPVVASKRSGLGDWIIRHGWRLAIGFSAVVWLIVAAFLVFG